MSFCSTVTCCECGKIYNDSTRRICVGNCRHSICLTCKNALETAACPICKKPDAFRETIFNHQSIDFLQVYQGKVNEHSFREIFNDLPNLGTGPCSNCFTKTKKLRVCTTCNSFVTRSMYERWRPAYTKHGPDVCLKIKESAICADCACDFHEGHNVILLLSVHGIDLDFERRTVKVQAEMSHKNLQESFEQGYVPEVAYRFRALLINWNADFYLEQISNAEMDLYNVTDDDPYWAKRLGNSRNSVQKWRRKVDALKKLHFKLLKEAIEHQFFSKPYPTTGYEQWIVQHVLFAVCRSMPDEYYVEKYKEMLEQLKTRFDLKMRKLVLNSKMSEEEASTIWLKVPDLKKFDKNGKEYHKKRMEMLDAAVSNWIIVEDWENKDESLQYTNCKYLGEVCILPEERAKYRKARDNIKKLQLARDRMMVKRLKAVYDNLSFRLWNTGELMRDRLFVERNLHVGIKERDTEETDFYRWTSTPNIVDPHSWRKRSLSRRNMSNQFELIAEK